MFKINGEEWDLRFVSPYSSILRTPQGNYTLGVTIPEWKRIYLSNNLSGYLFHHVLSHELSHAEFAARGLCLPEYVEECLADIIADNSLEVLKTANEIHCNLRKYYKKL